MQSSNRDSLEPTNNVGSRASVVNDNPTESVDLSARRTPGCAAWSYSLSHSGPDSRRPPAPAGGHPGRLSGIAGGDDRHRDRGELPRFRSRVGSARDRHGGSDADG